MKALNKERRDLYFKNSLGGSIPDSEIRTPIVPTLRLMLLSPQWESRIRHADREQDFALYEITHCF